MPDPKKLKVAPNDFLTEYEIKYFNDAKSHALWLFQEKFLTPREYNMICNRINRERMLIVSQREKEEEENE